MKGFDVHSGAAAHQCRNRKKLLLRNGIIFETFRRRESKFGFQHVVCGAIES